MKNQKLIKILMVMNKILIMDFIQIKIISVAKIILQMIMKIISK